MYQKRWWLGMAIVLLILAAFAGWCGDSGEVEEAQEEPMVDEEPRGALGAVEDGPPDVAPAPQEDTQPMELGSEASESQGSESEVDIIGPREEEQAWSDEESEEAEEETSDERRERIVREARERGMEIGVGDGEEGDAEEGEAKEGANDLEVDEEGAWQEWADDEAMESDPSLREDERVRDALEELEAEVGWEGDEAEIGLEEREAVDSVSGEALSTYQTHLDEAWQMEEEGAFMATATAGLAESLYMLSATTAMPRPQAARQRDQISSGSPPPIETSETSPGEEEASQEGLPDDSEIPTSEEEIMESEWTVWLEATEWLAAIQEENYPQLEEWMVDVEQAALSIDEEADAEDQMEALMEFFEAVEALLEAMVEEDSDVESAA